MTLPLSVQGAGRPRWGLLLWEGHPDSAWHALSSKDLMSSSGKDQSELRRLEEWENLETIPNMLKPAICAARFMVSLVSQEGAPDLHESERS